MDQGREAWRKTRKEKCGKAGDRRLLRDLGRQSIHAFTPSNTPHPTSRSLPSELPKAISGGSATFSHTGRRGCSAPPLPQIIEIGDRWKRWCDYTFSPCGRG
jgi:hypothetical protein